MEERATDRSTGVTRRAALRWLSAAAMMSLPAWAQTTSVTTAGVGPQAKTRAELDAVGELYESEDANHTIQLAAKFVRRFPDSEFVGYAQVMAMHSYAALGDYDGAIAAAQAALKLLPENTDALFTLAQLVADRPPASGALRRLARESVEKGLAEMEGLKLPRSANRREWLRSKKELLARGHCASGWLAFQEKRLDEALSELDQASELDPQGAYSYRIGIVLRAVGKTSAAVSAFEKAAAQGPEHVSALAAQQLKQLEAAGPPR